ncbi:MAG: PIG-L family deacetylase [Terriglobia bacterium]
MENSLRIYFLSSISIILLVAAVSVCPPAATGQSAASGQQASSQGSLKTEPASPVYPDARFKADILLIVAHPDDEQGVTGYLARAMDEHKKVAVLWMTRGDTGGDRVGWAKETALGAEREIEARQAVGFLGITNVWFAGAPNTPSQDVLWSLERWNHGAALEEAVRIVRLTRPEVIISLLPDYYTGENHGDHQAAGVIATEAFDMAGDPTKFPEQVVAPSVISSDFFGTEGLRPWQPEKIYYSANPAVPFPADEGPTYSTTDISPSRHVTYCELQRESVSFHRTQNGGFNQTQNRGARRGNSTARPCRPVDLIFGKSLVGGSVTGDVFEGVVPGPIPFAPVRGYQPETHTGLSLELAGQFAYYREFWAAHNIERIASLEPVQEFGVIPGGELPVPLLMHDYTDSAVQIDLTVDLPPGWTEVNGSGQYPVAARDQYPVEFRVAAPPKGTPEGKVGTWQQITWHARSAGQEIGSVTVKVYLEGHPGMPQ